MNSLHLQQAFVSPEVAARQLQAVDFCVAELVRQRAVPTALLDPLVAAVPCLMCVAAAGLFGSFDWCFGQTRAFLAVCLSGAGASATLLVCWGLYPAKPARAAAYAGLCAMAAAAPLLL